MRGNCEGFVAVNDFVVVTIFSDILSTIIIIIIIIASTLSQVIS